MSRPNSRRPIRRGLAILCASVAATVPGLVRADETRASADVSAGVGYSNNPFQGVGTSGSGFGQVGVSPQVRILNERRAITIGGDAFYQSYFKDYSDTTSVQGYADYADRLSETTSVHARLGYSSARLGTFGFGGLGGQFGGTLDPVVNPPVIDPVTGVGAGSGLVNPGVGAPIIPGAEVGAFGSGQRQRSFSANADFSSSISSRDSLTGSVFYVRSDFGGSRGVALGDYDGYGSTLGINRTLSERTSVGVQASVSSYDYQSVASDSRIYSLQGTISTRLSELWSLDGALGASYLDQQLGGSDTTLSGNVNACRRGERTLTCIQAARAILPTGFSGTRTQTSGGFSWNMQVGEFQNFSLSTSYIDLSGGTEQFGPQDDQYALANAGYSRQIGRRLRLNPSLYYRKVFGGNVQRDDDYGGQVSLSYRLGDLR